jgi:hypothetical protein
VEQNTNIKLTILKGLFRRPFSFCRYINKKIFMNYGFFERIDTSTSIEFYNTNPIENVNLIKEFKEFGLAGDFSSKKFKYSFDNAIWTSYIDLTTNNLSSIGLRDVDLYMNIIYEKIGDASISSCYLIYD